MDSKNIEYVNNKYLKKDVVEKRLYQELLSISATKQNTLVVAPTGLGKTIIAILLISYIYDKNKNILFLSPTKPLVNQHNNSLKSTLNIPENKIILLNGSVLPNKRKELYNNKGVVICATPQTIRNDLDNNLIDTNNFNLIIFDEAHRATGDYAYCKISQDFESKIKRLGLTASPGSNKKRIEAVANNLSIDKIEIKTDSDFDVVGYIKDIDLDVKLIELDDVSRKISRILDIYIIKKIQLLRKLNIHINSNFSKKQLLNIQKALFARIENSDNKFNYLAISNIASIIKVLHAKELIESQGFYALEKYIHKMFLDSKNKPSRALSQFLNSKELTKILSILHERDKTVKYSKESELEMLVLNFIKTNPNSKILIFNNFRDNANHLTNLLNENQFIKAKRFVGQACKRDDKGLNQKEQKQLIIDFKNNLYNTLVCTSVGEEGLDIPSVDLVVFYDAVASEIRAIQRRGRTGRFNIGKVVVLINKNTIDEKYYYVSQNKEKRMKYILTNFRKKPFVNKKRINSLKSSKSILDY